jgi:DNA gyrase subunit A
MIATTTQRDRVLPRLIEDEMRESFIDYSMSVIVQRALPDVRDGLKPVHRRILFAMHEAGLSPARPYKKSATVVGDVLGKYHPHGDSAVYDSLVRMVQDFSLRYPLVDGQGNFGSIDGDAAAAYRYTEARLSQIATEMLADIDRDTVDFAPNFDDRLKEPRVLPSRLPNLLVNGSSGIAVGMSTNIPPHNIGEVVRAAVHLLDHPECTVADLMKHVPGPDFPTGGMVVGMKGIQEAYEKGRGRVVMRARFYREQKRSGKEQIVITEIPYGTNKSRIIEQIAELTRAGKITDISDLRDESDREGIRVVIELKRGADMAKVMERLYKWTALQTTFGVISLALDKGVPREFSLKEILERYRDHRIEVVVRRSAWELGKARDEAHILRGLLVALKRIDEVVAIIRGSRNRDTAAKKLEKDLKLDDRQAEAILNMRLSRLTQLEGKELRERMAELDRRIAELEEILASPALQTAEVRRELLALSEEYNDPRRTQLYESEKDVAIQDLIAAEEVVVTVSREGYVRQIPMAVYQRGAKRGKGLSMDRYENDYIERAFVASTEDTLLFLSTDGRAFGLGVRDVPESSGRGKAIKQLFEGARNARIAAVHRVPEFRADRYVLFATAEGSVKRTALDQYARARGGIEAISLKTGDRVVDVRITDGEHEVVLAAVGGRAIRFAEGEIPAQGRASQGVRGIKLKGGEHVVGMAALRHEGELIAVTERGFAKRVPLAELPLQKRDGQGNAVHTPGKEMGTLAGMRDVHAGEDLMAVTAVGRTLRLKTDAAAVGTRMSEPEHAIPVSAHDRVVEITSLAEREAKPEDDDGPETAPPLVVEGEDEALTGPLPSDDDPAADEPAPEGEEAPGLVNRVAEQVAGGVAKVLDLFT